MKSKWMLKINKTDVKALASNLKVSETTATIMVNRGIKTKEEGRKFLDPNLLDLYKPESMRDMDLGVNLIKTAIEDKKKIVIYGDYDADGVTSTVILYKGLKNCGARVSYYIPDRENEGYGMSSDRIRKLKEEGTEVIISCDNGIAAVEQIALAKELGIQVVVTDHHELSFLEENGERTYILPPADAVINPKRNDCPYIFKPLCGAGIAYKFVTHLYTKMGINSQEANELLQYAAIGTICDVVDLLDENRIIAKLGLEIINKTENKGIKALIKETCLDDKKIVCYHIGFIIGPCINATGRLESAALSVELLISDDEKRVEYLAKILKDLNQKRQDMTKESVELVTEQIETGDIKNQKVIVVYREDIHESIAGIVAGKIKEKYNRPTIILTKGAQIPKGSGRSIEGYNLFEELIKCKQLLGKFGGHPMAAGLSIKQENIKLLRETLNANCILEEQDFIPKISIDKRLSLKDITVELIKELEILEPFGKGNPSPVLAEKNISIEGIKLLGKDHNTLKLFCRIDGGYKSIDALCFGEGKSFCDELSSIYGVDPKLIIENPLGLKLDIIYFPQINEYNGTISVQLRVKEYRIVNITL